ncbi:MAG: radical SAM protein [Candidatus Scalindua sediminis]|nr:radical SAM protein [Candidatus Scalindua sediminis]
MHILFIYTNKNSQYRIPAGPAIILRVLNNLGHSVSLYDTTFTNSNYQESTDTREKQRTVLKTDMQNYIGKIKQVNHSDELQEILNNKKPDLVFMSTAAHNYKFGISLLKIIKSHGDYTTLVGGIFPTICPDIVINNEYVDMVCVGEGEEAIIDLCERFGRPKDRNNNGKAYPLPSSEIPNIWIKQDGVVYRSRPKLVHNLDKVPYQDWSLFDKRHLWKAFVGKVWKSGGFELSRGCPQHCNFCVEDQKRLNTIGDGTWRREKTPGAVIKELKYFIEKYDLELITFGDMNFLSGSVEKTRRFSELYNNEIGLPFIIQSGPETLINEEKVKLLKEMNCVTISIGVESGVEEDRQRVLNKKVSNAHIIKAFENAKKYKIRTTANYIIGLPFDTEEKIKRSIEFNLKIMPDSIDVFYFIPFLGTHLFEIAQAEGLLPEHDEISADILSEPYLELPGLSKRRMVGLHAEFVERYNERFAKLGMQHGLFE